MTTPQKPNDPQSSWENHCSSLQAFKVEHGHGNVPPAYVSPEGHPLGRWLLDQRSKAQESLYPMENRQRLQALGVKWANQEGSPDAPSDNPAGTGNPPGERGEGPASDEGGDSAPRMRG